MLTELFYSLQYGNTALHLALRRGHTTCVEHLLSSPGIDVNNKNTVSGLLKCLNKTVFNQGNMIHIYFIVYAYRMSMNEHNSYCSSKCIASCCGHPK